LNRRSQNPVTWNSSMIRTQGLNAPVNIFSDSQAAILAIRKRRSGTANYIVEEIHELSAALRKRKHNLRITVHWVPGHSDVPRNDLVDLQAKKAAKGKTSTTTFLPKRRIFSNMRDSTAATKRQHKASLKDWAAREFRTSPRYGKPRQADPATPLSNFMKLTTGLTRAQRAVITQLRTGHCPLNGHLHRIGRADSPICPSCNGNVETPLHYLTLCPAFRHLRTPLIRKLGGRVSEIKFLLSNRRIIPDLLIFIDRTERLRHVFGKVELRDRKAFEQGTRGTAKSNDVLPPRE